MHNVWQYTDEFQDEHTCAAMIMGGSHYRPVPQKDYPFGNWYFPSVKKVSQHGKYLLMDDTYERSGTVGFRCVFDTEESSMKEGGTTPLLLI